MARTVLHGEPLAQASPGIPTVQLRIYESFRGQVRTMNWKDWQTWKIVLGIAVVIAVIVWITASR